LRTSFGGLQIIRIKIVLGGLQINRTLVTFVGVGVITWDMLISFYKKKANKNDSLIISALSLIFILYSNFT
jgi:hypothetical protein